MSVSSHTKKVSAQHCSWVIEAIRKGGIYIQDRAGRIEIIHGRRGGRTCRAKMTKPQINDVLDVLYSEGKIIFASAGARPTLHEMTANDRARLQAAKNDHPSSRFYRPSLAVLT